MNPSPTLVEFKTVRGEPHVFFLRQETPAVNFTNLCIQHGFSMEQIAQHLNISSGTLRTSFARYAGLAPKHWMAQHRVLLSIRMIRQGVSLNKITSALGYHDYPHMAKEFKSVVGHTPKQMETCLNLLQESGNTRQ